MISAPARALSCLSCILVLGVFASPAAAVVTFDFEGDANGAKGKYNTNASTMYSATVEGLTVRVLAGLYETEPGGALSVDADCADGSCGVEGRVLRKTASGLGLRGPKDRNPDIDGFWGNDLISFAFDTDVILKSVTFRWVDSNDRADILVDDVMTWDEAPIYGGTPFGFPDYRGTHFGFGADDALDNFRISQLVVEQVEPKTDQVPLAATPLPASLLLMLSTLVGLRYGMRRSM